VESVEKPVRNSIWSRSSQLTSSREQTERLPVSTVVMKPARTIVRFKLMNKEEKARVELRRKQLSAVEIQPVLILKPRNVLFVKYFTVAQKK